MYHVFPNHPKNSDILNGCGNPYFTAAAPPKSKHRGPDTAASISTTSHQQITCWLSPHKTGAGSHAAILFFPSACKSPCKQDGYYTNAVSLKKSCFVLNFFMPRSDFEVGNRRTINDYNQENLDASSNMGRRRQDMRPILALWRTCVACRRKSAAALTLACAANQSG